jgi:putative DNA primase/helicase
MNVGEILSKLHGVRREGNGWKALCPAHGDKNPSLSIHQMDGRILLYCHAGCSAQAILAALAIEARDLFEDGRGGRQIVAEYDYRDEKGELLFQVVRFEPKDFRQRRPDGNGGWTWKLNNTRRVLYRLADVMAARSVVICEGEKDCETARGLDLVATCNPHGAGKWKPEYAEPLKGKRVCVVADADEPGRKHAQDVAESLFGKAESLKMLELPGAKDLSDWVMNGGTRRTLLELIQHTPEWKGVARAGSGIPLVAIPVEELLTREIKPREMLLDPILPEQGLVMLYAYRGIGKTFLALGIAAAIASGTRFLQWSASRSRRVLYVDGELPASTVRDRLAMVLAGIEGGEPAPESLSIVTPDFQERPMPDLATVEGQRLLEPHLAGIDLLVLDNLSALCRDGNENEGEGWLPVQEWALQLRRRGISVLFVHHAGKNKMQRGTSRREDLLDTVITLKNPSDYNPSEGLRCEIHFEKTRGMLGDAARPFEVRMESGPDGRAVWTCRGLEDAKAERAAELFVAGMSVREVAEELDISKSQAGRLRQRCANGNLRELSQRPIA